MKLRACCRTGLVIAAACVIGGWPSARASAAIKVACVGDSVTVGVAATAPNRYPTLLAQRLGAAYEVQNFGLSATTMLKKGTLPYWNSTQFVAAGAFAPNIVLIMLGTNDSKLANWGTMSAAFSDDYKAMIEHFRALPSHPTVYALLPPPVFGTNPFMIRGPTIEQEVVPAIQAVAAATGTATIDVFSALRGAQQDFPDNVHPNDAGNMKIANAVYRALAMPVSDGGTDGVPASDARGADAGVDMGRDMALPDAVADAEREAAPAGVDAGIEMGATTDVPVVKDGMGRADAVVTVPVAPPPPAPPRSSSGCSMTRGRGERRSGSIATFAIVGMVIGMEGVRRRRRRDRRR